jgi:hypothetical protein
MLADEHADDQESASPGHSVRACAGADVTDSADGMVAMGIRIRRSDSRQHMKVGAGDTARKTGTAG